VDDDEAALDRTYPSSLRVQRANACKEPVTFLSIHPFARFSSHELSQTPRVSKTLKVSYFGKGCLRRVGNPY
jgi:hypothetical protein